MAENYTSDALTKSLDDALRKYSYGKLVDYMKIKILKKINYNTSGTEESEQCMESNENKKIYTVNMSEKYN